MVTLGIALHTVSSPYHNSAKRMVNSFRVWSSSVLAMEKIYSNS